MEGGSYVVEGVLYAVDLVCVAFEDARGFSCCVSVCACVGRWRCFVKARKEVRVFLVVQSEGGWSWWYKGGSGRDDPAVWSDRWFMTCVRIVCC